MWDDYASTTDNVTIIKDLQASLKQAQERIQELDKENRQLNCEHSWDSQGVCELCGLGETDEMKAAQKEYNKTSLEKKVKSEVVGKIRELANNKKHNMMFTKKAETSSGKPALGFDYKDVICIDDLLSLLDTIEKEG